MKYILLYVIDKILFILFYPFYFVIKKKKIKEDQPVFLLSRLDLIGDVLMTTCAIRAIKEQYPTSKIYILLNPACSKIVELNPFLDGIFYYSWPWPWRTSANKWTANHLVQYFKLYKKLRDINADTFIEFRGDIRIFFLFGFLLGIRRRVSSLRTGGVSLLTNSIVYHKDKHELERVVGILESINIIVIKKRPEIFFSSGDSEMVNQLLTNYMGRDRMDYAIISPFSGKEIKEWIPGNWAVVAHYLFNTYHLKSFIVGARNNKEIASYISNLAKECTWDITGDTSLAQLGVLMSKSKLVIGVDSGPLHLASCFDIPILSLFGPTNPIEFRPFSPYARVIDLNVCVCNKDKYDVCYQSQNGHTLCMVKITPEIVCNEIDKFGQSQGKSNFCSFGGH